MEYETKMTKTHSGYKAETCVSLGTITFQDCGEFAIGERELSLTTSKHGHGGMIWSCVSVAILRDTGRGYRTKTTGIGSDFFKTVQRVVTKPITERKIKEWHNVALEHFPALVEEAKAFYAAK